MIPMKMKWYFWLLCLTLLTACSRTDPQAVLDKTVDQLQSALAEKKTSEVMEMLHPDFYAQQPGDNREWARHTMTMMFLRFKNIHIVALKKQNDLDPDLPDTARTHAEVTLTGAEGLIPDNARHYQVTMQWKKMDDEWKLHRILWE